MSSTIFKSKPIKIAAALVLALVLQGCVTATVATVAAAAGFGSKVALDPRTAGTQVDDETLEFKVKDFINQDANIKNAGRIEVLSYEGKVTLVGQLQNTAAIEMAANRARQVKGVSVVYNEIRNTTPIGLKEISNDSIITGKIKSKILLNSNLKTNNIKVVTENGEVFFVGRVTEAQAQIAFSIAQDTTGVKKIINAFTIIAPEPAIYNANTPKVDTITN